MRYQELSTRKYDSIIHHLDTETFEQFTLATRETKWKRHTWKGLTLMKDPMSLSIYTQLFQEIKPKTIIEFGTYDGGSALWFRDMLTSLRIETEVHTFDINKPNLGVLTENNIHFHQLDNHRIKEYISNNNDFFKKLAHPIIMIEDSHENFCEVVRSLNPFLINGDYLIIEDTIQRSKHKQMYECLQKMNYLVDTYYCDLWGNNNSWNINSILTKTNNN